MQPLITILGPTASGKTDLSIKLCKEFNGYVVSADSCQVYKEMDIGTAKITKEEMEGVPHFTLDVVSPDQLYSVAEYKKEVDKTIKKKAGTPFLVGGTMQYIDAVVDNWILPKTKPDQKLRDELEKEPLEKLQAQLQTFDPESYNTIDINNKRKIIRSLEIVKATGISPTRARRRGKPKYRTLKIGVTRPREELNERINKRVDILLEKGLLNEVKALVDKYGWDAPGIQAQGYKEFKPHFEGEATLRDCAEKLKTASRRYAKRQMTWWKRDKDIQWIKDDEEAQALIQKFL